MVLKNSTKRKPDAQDRERRRWHHRLTTTRWSRDNYPSVADQPLTGIELEAKAHWARFCPNLVASLEAQGPEALETAVRAAWWRMEYLSRLQQVRAPELHRLQAEALFQDLLWLAPESPDQTQATLFPTR